MIGYIIVNKFLNTSKYSEINEMLLEAFNNCGINVSLVYNDEILIGMDLGKFSNADFFLMWDKSVDLAKYLELLGYRVFNRGSAIDIADDKLQTYLQLMDNNINQALTISAPFTYSNIGFNDDLNFLDTIEENLTYPIVIKERRGSFGEQVYIANDKNDLIEITKKKCKYGLIYQEFIKTFANDDYRLEVVGNKVVAAMRRFAKEGDFRANITNGGRAICYEPNDVEIAMALRVCKIMGLDFAGVDLIKSVNGKIYVCEVNSNAHFKNLLNITGVNAANYIAMYIKEKIDAGNNI